MIIAPDWLLTSAVETPRQGWGIRIVGATVDSIGPLSSLLHDHPEEEVVDASGHVVMPGFVNSHTHLYGVLAHGIEVKTPPTGFGSFLDDFWWPQVEDRLDQTMISAASEWGCVEMIRSGTTTFYDICEAPNALGGVLAAQAEAIRPSGLRAILSFEATERSGVDVGQRGIAENVEFISGTGHDPLTSGLMCWHTTFTCSPAFIEQAHGLAADLGVMSHAHANEGTTEGEHNRRTSGEETFEVYRRLGIAGPELLASQCVQLSNVDQDILVSSGVRVSHMPLSNCEVGGGFAPVPELSSRGTVIGLGTDGYVNDMFEVMRGAFWMHKARLTDPATMPSSTVFAMATEGGARALGLSQIGRLEAGWSADLQVVDIRLPTDISAENLIDQVLLWRSGHDVRDTMAAGRWLMRDRVVLTLDAQRARERTAEEARRLWDQ